MKRFRVRVQGTSPDGKSNFVDYKIVMADFTFEARDLAIMEVKRRQGSTSHKNYNYEATEIKGL